MATWLYAAWLLLVEGRRRAGCEQAVRQRPDQLSSLAVSYITAVPFVDGATDRQRIQEWSSRQLQITHGSSGKVGR